MEQDVVRYYLGIRVELNENAYANKKIILMRIREMLLPAIDPGFPLETSRLSALGALDAATFHKREAIKQLFKENGIALSMIPAGCTSITQNIYLVVNQPFKKR